LCLPVSRLFWVLSLAYPNLLGTKGYVVVVVDQWISGWTLHIWHIGYLHVRKLAMRDVVIGQAADFGVKHLHGFIR
jgi:type IV secretory pathway TrbD component